MTFSEIIVQFDRQMEVGETVKFKFGNDLNSAVETFEVWRPVRQQSNEVTKNGPTFTGPNGEPQNAEESPENSARYYRISIEADYNLSDQFDISLFNDRVIIKAKDEVTQFFESGGNPQGVNFIINNQEVSNYRIENHNFSSFQENQCSRVNVNVVTSEITDEIVSPIQRQNVNSDAFTFDFQRGSTINLIVRNSNNEEANKVIELPDELSEGNIDVNVSSAPESNTAIINVDFRRGLELEYSLDDQNYQTDNTFNDLAEGDYTAFVRDQFGCKASKDFNVVNFEAIISPFFSISKANSIRYANRVTHNDCGNYKNDENTLSCEMDVPLPYKEIQQFQTCDVITTQFKSNYSQISANVKMSNSAVGIPVEKKTNNIGVKDKRDAVKISTGFNGNSIGKLGIYFTSGNTYDYDSNAVNGTYTLNGRLPEWAKEGNFINVEGSWLQIINIYFNESRNADVVVTDKAYNEPDKDTIVSSIYNRFNFEVYEFEIDMLDYINKQIQVQIINRDDLFDNITYLSELIDVKVRHINTVEIKYRNKTNTDIFFATGIQHTLRIPIERISAITQDENETYKTDTSAILLSADVYEGNQFEFQPVTKEMMRKILIALSHSDVKIDGVDYVKSESFEVEGPLEDTNLYVVRATMLKTKGAFVGEEAGFNTTDTEIPGLVKYEDGYMKY